ncbi:alpha/beta fold hydrolase [Kribbella sp. CA-293567]|uniref:alpha/beta fold hydrolase n=1 Tax=Kribbella sp. CA-293567 TaxID=3002436 RepID=UPI0022DE64A8|nr:alpha/beta hydrolase [Kribbella sp. CA-293567]WBQ03913.1 alpha/beta fold hydrolase [Kribbella sp. CA-293567]
MNTHSPLFRSLAGAQLVRKRYDAVLTAWPVRAEHRVVGTAFGDTFVSLSGDPAAPPLVLLHGSGSSTAEWGESIETLARHFRTVAVDLIGEPGRSAPTRADLDAGEMAQWLGEVMDSLDLAAAEVAAISLGAWVAVDFASRHPERVRRLVLQSPAGIGRAKYGWLPKAIVAQMLGGRAVRRSAARVAGLDLQEHSAILDGVALIFTHYKPRPGVPHLSDDILRRVASPTLVLVGEADAMYDAAQTAERSSRLIENSTVHTVPRPSVRPAMPCSARLSRS